MRFSGEKAGEPHFFLYIFKTALWVHFYTAANIQKILLNPATPMVNFAREANIPNSTVATWLRNYKKRNGSTVSSKKKSWSAERKFQAVLETASISEAEKNEYCRKHGIYPEQLKEWKKDCISGCRKSPDKNFIKKTKQKEQELKRKTKALEKELSRKEKALAEAAALLVLKKSSRDLGGQRGRMVPTEDKKLILSLIEEACNVGAHQCKACEIIGISDKRHHIQRSPANKLSEEEKQTILAICNSQEYGSLPHSQIVLRLCDQGIYVASEASFYRILRKNGLQNHRGTGIKQRQNRRGIQRQERIKSGHGI